MFIGIQLLPQDMGLQTQQQNWHGLGLRQHHNGVRIFLKLDLSHCFLIFCFLIWYFIFMFLRKLNQKCVKKLSFVITFKLCFGLFNKLVAFLSFSRSYFLFAKFCKRFVSIREGIRKRHFISGDNYYSELTIKKYLNL